MTLQTLIDAWITSGAFHSVNSPATESEIRAAEAKIGTTLPQLLREFYLLFNGGTTLVLVFFIPRTRPT